MRAHAAWLLLFAVAAMEVVGHFVVASRVPEASDWRAAGEHVRAAWQDGDAASAAPHWADPLMREALGETLDLETAGRADLATSERLWVFSIRGHRSPEAPEGAPAESRAFGRVLVERYDLAPRSEVLFDLVAHVADASVTLLSNGGERPCRFTRGRATGGGLGSGPVVPAERHVCDPARAWMWVGATVEEDLAMLPRRCVWQHPSGGEDVVRATFSDVPLGTRVILHAGLWWEHERTLDGGPVDVALRIDGEEVGRLVHEDGDGWKRIEASVPEALRGGRARIDVDVSAPRPHLRTLCWAARTEQDR